MLIHNRKGAPRYAFSVVIPSEMRSIDEESTYYKYYKVDTSAENSVRDDIYLIK